jgi:predicted DCC family thiol-disulfide oxidoreductase YuxK
MQPTTQCFVKHLVNFVNAGSWLTKGRRGHDIVLHPGPGRFPAIVAARQRDYMAGQESVTMREPALIIYDGDCVFCQNYVRFFRLRDSVGPVELIDARSGDPRVARYWQDGHDLNEGMLFVLGDRVFHGDEAVHVLATLSSERGWFNRLNAAVFSSRGAARLLYPALKLGRRLTLLLRGRGLIARPDLSR